MVTKSYVSNHFKRRIEDVLSICESIQESADELREGMDGNHDAFDMLEAIGNAMDSVITELEKAELKTK